jgi:hypothetical protein
MTQQYPPQFPPQQPYPGAPPPENNGWAVASLVCGLLLCIPGIAGLLAIIFGVLGIKQSNQLAGRGRGLAVAGLILGVLALIGWTAAGATMYWGYKYVEGKVLDPSKAVSTTFLNSLASGDIATAKSVTTGSLTDDDLAKLRDQLKSLGGFQSFSLNQFNANGIGGDAFKIDIAGAATFQNGTKRFNAELRGDLQSGFKIEDFSLE